MSILDRCSRPLKFDSLMYFGNGGVGAESVSAALQLMLAKSEEWRNCVPLHVFEADVQTAFDRLTPALCVDALLAWEVPLWLVASILREMARLTATCVLQGVGADSRVEFNRCIRQGGIESGILWMRAITHLMQPVCARWVRDGLGFDFQGFRLTVLLWVDNVWVFSHNRAGMITMASHMTEALEPLLLWKPSSLKFLTTSRIVEERAAFTVRSLYDHLVVPNVCDMTVLGSHVQANFKINTSVNKRRQAGNGAFFSDYEFYASKYIPLKEKINRYSLHVLPKALYGSGSWYFSRTLYNRLRAWENNFFKDHSFCAEKT